jgi:O-antigen ligase
VQGAYSEWKLAGLLLVVALIFGGGGSPAPLQEALVQLAALSVLTFLIAKGRARFFERVAEDPWLWSAVALAAAVPLIQLVPLPPAVWTALPGRELQSQSLGLLVQGDTWRPLSLFPLRTLSSFLSLLPPLVMLFLVAGMNMPDKVRMLGAIWVAALASAVLGVAQLSGGDFFYPYVTAHVGYATGFFASRNAQADLLAIGVVAAAGWFVASRELGAPRPAAVVVALALFLAIAVITTGSRSGMAMLVVAGAAAFLILAAPRWPWWKIAAAPGAAGLLAALFYSNPVVQRSLARFDNSQDLRPFVWEDTVFAASHYFPAGSGMGTFVPVFRLYERLEIVNRSYVNRAHNDFLELLLEGGILSLLVLLCFALFMLVRAGSAILARQEPVRSFGWCAAFSWLLLGLHSVVDYPLRNQLIMVVAALLLGLTAKTHRSEPPGRRRSDAPGVGSGESSARGTRKAARSGVGETD